MQQKDATHDGEKPAESTDNVNRRQLAPLPEQNGRGRDRESGEHDVIDGRDQGGVEDVQRPVEVVHLHQDASRHCGGEEPGEGVEELRVPAYRQLDGYAQAFAGHH